MFTFTYEWLHRYYGSHGPAQIEQAAFWLHQHGVNLPDDITEWCTFKHLIEYQVNTNDIVQKCFDKLGTFFPSELAAHAFVNRLRVPAAFDAYVEALYTVGPIRSIIELGVGGDSAISTACFLHFLETMRPMFKDPVILMSCDHNPLGMTKERYKDVPYWNFFQVDSLEFLQECQKERVRPDLVFIDTSHSYRHTLQELSRASKITNTILMDDATFEGNITDNEPGGVKKAIHDWLKYNAWNADYFADNTVCLLRKFK